MRRGKLLAIIAVIAVILMISVFPTFSLADAGGFAGDSDWGGGSDWGGSDWGGSDWDSDYSSGGFFFAGGSGGGGMGRVIEIVIIAVIVALVVASINKKKKQRPVSVRNNQAPRNADISALRNADPAFSEQVFLEDVKNLYVRLQNAWTEKKLEQVRPDFSGAMYAQLERQLEPFIKYNQTNYVDRIAVLSADIVDYRQDASNDIITVMLQTRIVDYVKSDVDGELIRGSETKELFMTYEWSLIRTKGRITPVMDGEEKRTTCPACGAPVDLNHTAKCEYCGTVIETGDYDWVVNEIRGISQRSGS